MAGNGDLVLPAWRVEKKAGQQSRKELLGTLFKQLAAQGFCF